MTRSGIESLAIVTAAVAACAIAGVGIGAATAAAPPVLVFPIAVAFAAWHSGRGAALFATVLSLVLGVLFFRGNESASFPADSIRLALLAVVSLAISGLAGSLHAARAALLRETSRLDALVRQLPFAVVVFDSTGTVIHANEGVRETLGHASLDRMDADWAVYDAEGRKIPPEEFSTTQALRGEKVLGREVRYVRPDGTQTWLDTSAVPLVEDGRVTGAIIAFFDIGGRKRLQLELEENRRRLRIAHESARSGSFDHDIRTNLSVWSEELELLYGMAPGSFRGTREEWKSRVHPDDVERAERDIAAAVKGGTFVSEWRVILPDGAIRYIEAQGRAWLDENGAPTRLAGVNIDVTERRETEERLRAAQANLEVALAASRMGAWHLDLRTGQMHASDTCKANFGRVASDPFTYEDAVAATHPEDRPAMQESMRLALEEKRDYAAEFRVVWPDGTVRWIAARGRAQFDESGKPTAMDGVTIDFTGRKLLEEELHEKTQSLQAADRRKDQFLAILGHELRNPLAPLTNAVHLLKAKGADAVVRERLVALMERQALQMGRLVDELMDVSRIAQGKVRLERTSIELAEVVEEALEACDPLIVSKGHAVVRELPPPGTTVDADHGRLLQVLSNLINNAAKYTDPGGRIRVSVESAGGMAIISIEDNGVGIAPASLERVFDVFAQLDESVGRSQGGLGLGLNVARRLVEMHGGAIGAHSAGLGQGSVFTVTLPLRVPALSHQHG